MGQIAFLGLDSISCHLASHLARAGYVVQGWNPILDCPFVLQAAAAEVNVLPTLADALDDADYIFIYVDDLTTLESLLFKQGGVIEQTKIKVLIVNLTPIRITAAREIAKLLTNRGVRFLNALISGEEADADSGHLTLLVRGNLADFNECYSRFQAIGETVIYDGELGR